MESASWFCWLRSASFSGPSAERTCPAWIGRIRQRVELANGTRLHADAIATAQLVVVDAVVTDKHYKLVHVVTPDAPPGSPSPKRCTRIVGIGGKQLYGS